MSDVWNDLRYSLRSLRKRPGFSIAVLVTLGFGIGLCAGVFSMVNTLLLRPLPFPEPSALVHVWGADPRQGWNRLYVSGGDFLDLERDTSAFEEAGAFLNAEYNLSSDEASPERVAIARVTAGVFDALAVPPAHGRPILEDDLRTDRAVAVLSHNLWQRRFGSDPDLVGRTVLLHSEPHEVVGIMPPSFAFPMPTTEVWVPAPLDLENADRSLKEYQVVARLAPGVGMDQAQAELDAVAQRLQAAYPEESTGAFRAVPLREALLFAHDRVEMISWILAVAVLFVLLVVCANVGNLMLARYAARQQEVAIRNAMGAEPRRLLRQFFTESLVLSFAGAVLGLALAHFAVRAATVTVPDNLYRVGDFGLDLATIAFAVGLTLLTAILVGLVPALQIVQPRVVEALKEGTQGASSRSRKRYDVLVVCQIATAAVLLVGALLMLQSVAELREVDPGFGTEDVLAFKVTLPTSYDEAQQAEFVHRVSERLRALPGVRQASAVNFVPLNNETLWLPFRIEGREVSSEREAPSSIVLYTSADYHDVMEVELLEGRTVDERDSADAPNVLVVNRALAERYWPGEDPLGQRISFTRGGDDPVWWRIVGVTENYHHVGLDAGPWPQVYVPYYQRPWDYFRFLVATEAPPQSLLPSIRTAMAGIDPNVPVTEARMLREVVLQSLTIQDFISRALTVLAIGALLLAAVGLYGVMSLRVNRSFREIGLRMALGAERRSVLRQVIRQSVKLVGLGLGIGLVLAAGMTFGLSRMLYGIHALDPLTFLGVTALLFLVGLLAAYLPARRASHLDPMVALRHS